MVNTEWRWSSDCPRHHTHTHTYTHTHTHAAYNYTQRHMMLENIRAIHNIFCRLLICSSLLISHGFECVCCSFHSNHSLLSVVQTNTSVPPGFSPRVSAALWATWLTDGKDSDKVTVPKKKGGEKKENVSSMEANSISNSAIWGLVGDKYSAFVYCVIHYNDCDRFSRGCCCQIKNKKIHCRINFAGMKGKFCEP